MIIRPEQFEAFQRVADEAFAEQVVDHVLWEHAEELVQIGETTLEVAEISDVVLREMVREAIRRARSYGLRWESTLTAFVALMFVIAPNFDEHPLIQRVLRNDREPPDSRIDLLMAEISDESWDAAKENYDPHAWKVELNVPED